jgi:hypothetical protein
VSGLRCEDTYLLVAQCACKNHRGGQEVTDELKTVGQPFEARFPGLCPACERPIHEGQLIARLADEDDYVHVGRCPR